MYKHNTQSGCQIEVAKDRPNFHNSTERIATAFSLLQSLDRLPESIQGCDGIRIGSRQGWCQCPGFAKGSQGAAHCSTAAAASVVAALHILPTLADHVPQLYPIRGSRPWLLQWQLQYDTDNCASAILPASKRFHLSTMCQCHAPRHGQSRGFYTTAISAEGATVARG